MSQAKSIYLVLLTWLSTSLVTIQPAQAEIIACSSLVVPGQTFTAHHIFAGDPNLFTDTLRIVTISGQAWRGTFGSSNEPVNGIISGSSFTMRRQQASQTWSGTCFDQGISGNTRGNGRSDTGTFVLKP